MDWILHPWSPIKVIRGGLGKTYALGVKMTTLQSQGLNSTNGRI